jgi:hypothetical protein
VGLFVETWSNNSLRCTLTILRDASWLSIYISHAKAVKWLNVIIFVRVTSMCIWHRHLSSQETCLWSEVSILHMPWS